MNILHYILGFPPVRSGGLTKYAVDLMQSQIQLGHRVFAVYPGNPSLLSRKKTICEKKECCGIPTFRINNALLLPLLHGMKSTWPFVAKDSDGLDAFRAFFKVNRFDVLHVHTMMGLPVSFLLAAKENEVKIVYTSHDYFGLCPRVNFIDQNNCVCENADSKKCAKCNEYAKPLWFLWLRNSKLLILYKKMLKR